MLQGVVAADPRHDAPHFVCPNCGIGAQHHWHRARIPHNLNNHGHDPRLQRADCVICGQSSYWVDARMVWPPPGLSVKAPVDLPEELAGIFEEARTVGSLSPRAAAGLLRLLVEQLLDHIGAPEGTLFDRVDVLCNEGRITRRTRDLLDAVRISGNSAVHEGVIFADGDDAETIMVMFDLVERVVVEVIGHGVQADRLIGDKRRRE